MRIRSRRWRREEKRQKRRREEEQKKIRRWRRGRKAFFMSSISIKSKLLIIYSSLRDNLVHVLAWNVDGTGPLVCVSPPRNSHTPTKTELKRIVTLEAQDNDVIRRCDGRKLGLSGGRLGGRDKGKDEGRGTCNLSPLGPLKPASEGSSEGSFRDEQMM